MGHPGRRSQRPIGAHAPRQRRDGDRRAHAVALQCHMHRTQRRWQIGGHASLRCLQAALRWLCRESQESNGRDIGQARPTADDHATELKAKRACKGTSSEIRSIQDGEVRKEPGRHRTWRTSQRHLLRLHSKTGERGKGIRST